MTLRHLRRMWPGDCRGAAVAEFAIVAPVMILLLAGSVELGRLAMINSALESAVSTAARAARVNLDIGEEQRDEDLRQRISNNMKPFRIHPGKEMVIETKVYRNFGESYPESYEDMNGNGQYDGPAGEMPGEPFEDRNGNGVYDSAVQQAGMLGGAGDVVSYRVDFPVELLFGFLAVDWLKTDGVNLTSSVVVRNEPVQPADWVEAE